MKNKFLLPLMLFMALSGWLGCSSKEQAPSADEMEKTRQHHIDQAKRFQKEG